VYTPKSSSLKTASGLPNNFCKHIRVNNLNVSIETLLQQLKKSEEEKQKLLEKTINLEQKNQDLNIKVMQLQAEVIKLAKDTKKHKKAEAIAIKTMKKVFTPRQIKMLREY